MAITGCLGEATTIGFEADAELVAAIAAVAALGL